MLSTQGQKYKRERLADVLETEELVETGGDARIGMSWSGESVEDWERGIGFSEGWRWRGDFLIGGMGDNSIRSS